MVLLKADERADEDQDHLDLDTIEPPQPVRDTYDQGNVTRKVIVRPAFEELANL